MPEPSTPRTLPSLLAEVLTEAIPYKAEAEIPLTDSFYLVCEYPFLPKGTVLFCLRPGETRVQVKGFLPDATDTERMALESLLARNTSGKKSLTIADLERSQLQVCAEARGVQRLIDLQRELSEHDNDIVKTKFH